MYFDLTHARRPMRPTSADLKGLWLHAYSRSSLMQADQWVADMNQEILNPNSVHLFALPWSHTRDLSQRHKLQNRSASSPLTEIAARSFSHRHGQSKGTRNTDHSEPRGREFFDCANLALE
jgi:hypothetical protein